MAVTTGCETPPTVEAIYATHQPALLAHLTRLVADRALAEDLCQETFIKVLRKWDQRDEINNLTAWLYRIATNTAYDELRRRRRITFSPLSLVSSTASAPTVMETQVDEQEPIHQVLSQLPMRAQQLLVLALHTGHSTHEIADALECSDAAVRLRLFRARARFRKLYLEMN